LLLSLTFGYFVMDSFFHPLEYTNFNELVFYTILYSVTWVVALYNYRYIKTIFGKNKLIFLAILLIAYPAIRLMMKILFETEYPMGIEVSLILLIQSITIFICSYKLSEK